MKKITRIVGVDCKIGRKSRTGSTVTMSVPDEFIIDCTKYYGEFNSGEEIKGKIRKIELNLIYEDDLMEDEKVEQKIIDIDDALKTVVDEERKLVAETEEEETE